MCGLAAHEETYKVEVVVTTFVGAVAVAVTLIVFTLVVWLDQYKHTCHLKVEWDLHSSGGCHGRNTKIRRAEWCCLMGFEYRNDNADFLAFGHWRIPCRIIPLKDIWHGTRMRSSREQGEYENESGHSRHWKGGMRGESARTVMRIYMLGLTHVQSR